MSMRSWCKQLAFAVVMLAALSAHAANGSFCADCEVSLGVGGTYHFWGRTSGIVIPVTFTFDEDRYELGAFRMSRAQHFYDPTFHTNLHLADPYWGFSLSRRLELVRRQHFRLFIGLGASYKTQENELSASLWNFAEQLGVRFLPIRGAAIELCARHWSNAGLKTPNRGQDFATLTFVVSPGELWHRSSASDTNGSTALLSARLLAGADSSMAP
jgi:hypothetical protein